jgi:2-oxoglutarate dehydrogenase E1 component
MYQRIRQLPTTRERYAQRLIDETVISADVPKSWSEHYRASLDAGASVARGYMPKEEAHYPHAVDWTPYLSQECDDPISTGVDLEIIRSLTDTLTTLPQGFETHPQVAKVLENRRKMAAGAMPIDWGYAETLAYATLLREGYGVRLSGQDSGRGTFFHRHAVIYNQKDGTARVPLRHLFSGQPNFLVVNSLLSEEAVLAFEYGYATAEPETLTIWEAQFGDFANNAQVVIDQFISSGELKWDRLSGIVLLLPHGYEGQGPEHSSARLERYLQLCAQQNMVVSAPSTPVQLFHLLRRQMLWRCRKPLIVLTPKSLLRQQQSFSTLNELCQGSFQELLPDVTQGNESSVRRVVICSGKVYFDLYEERAQQQRSDVALIRIEQLYPFPEQRLADELRRYSNIDTYVWCQEEPKNQGAWYSSQHHIRAVVPNEATLVYAGRPHSAAPAVGYYPVHIAQQRELVAQALGGI